MSNSASNSLLSFLKKGMKRRLKLIAQAFALPKKHNEENPEIQGSDKTITCEGNLINTWTEDRHYSNDMKVRGERMLQIATEFCSWNSILDVGCGNQQLKPVIEKMNPGSIYFGVDRLMHCKDTLLADFNKGEFPDIKVDLTVLSGIIEYIYPSMIESFFDHVCASAPTIVISYWPTDYSLHEAWFASGKMQRSTIWVNSFNLGEIISFFSVRGFHLERIERYHKTSQYLLLLQSKPF